MINYTLSDFGRFRKGLHGRLYCPAGNYENIKTFPNDCVFLGPSIFSDGSKFGACAVFNMEIEFPNRCEFGDDSKFASYSTFGQSCKFGMFSRFGHKCEFGKRARFGKHCEFGDETKFNDAIVEQDISLRNFLKFEGFGSIKRTIYLYHSNNNNIFVRCGCFLGSLQEFRKRVFRDYKFNKYARGYYKMLRLAKWQFKKMDLKVNNEYIVCSK